MLPFSQNEWILLKGLIQKLKIIKDICNRIAIILEIIKDINLFEKNSKNEKCTAEAWTSTPWVWASHS